MFVVKRKGNREEVSFNKIHNRIKWLTNNPHPLKHVNPSLLSQKVIQNIYDGISTSEIDNYTANLSESMSVQNIDYNSLAGRIVVNNCHKNTLRSFRDKVTKLYMRKDIHGKSCPIVTDEFYKFVVKNQIKIEDRIDYQRDYLFDFFGFRTLEKGYLLKIDGKPVERPQDMYMRVAIHIHMDNTNYKSEKSLELIFETYNLMSNKFFIHATPTLFNAGTINSGLASCFLLGTEDSLEGIMNTASHCANISKNAGGIGFHMSNWRSAGSMIRSTNGKSSGIVPFLRIFNDIARAFNQGGKRLGSFAAYLEPHHPDIMEFLELRRNHGDENMRTRDLFMALWISDLFMTRVKSNGKWSTFDPDECPGLTECYGDEYEKLYTKYENAGRAAKVYDARKVWSAIFTSQKESGQPYMLYKDSINKNNNQSNMGIIKSSNLCCEITIYSDSNEFGVCVLSSICLPKFVEDTYTNDELKIPENQRRSLDHTFPKHPKINYSEIARISSIVCRNLNRVIDSNKYPCEEARRSSIRGRPIGIGIQGLADVFYKLKLPFGDDKSRVINKKICEAIYFGAVSMSTQLAKEEYQKLKKSGDKDCDKLSGAYPAFIGSPMHKGKLHWENYIEEKDLSGSFDWKTVKEHIKMYGLRNSLLTAFMPTASTSHINGNIECFEPLTSNMYKRKVLSGEFIIINKYMINDLRNMNLWNADMINYLKMNGGSVQGIIGLPDEFKKLYRTIWEIPQKTVIDMCADRQPFIDQSQSMNLFFENYTIDKFTSAQFHAWRSGLKTGSYYIRTQPSVAPQKFTVNPNDAKLLQQFQVQAIEATTDNLSVQSEDDICLLCSS